MFLFKLGKFCIMFVGATTVAMLVVAFGIMYMIIFGGVQ